MSEAERAYEQVLRDFPRDVTALFQYAVLEGEIGRLDVAERCLAQAAALCPQEASLHHALGLVHARQLRFADAIECYDHALRLEPTHLGALVGRADALHQVGDLRAAERVYRDCLARTSQDWSIRFRLATVLSDQGRFSDAAAIYCDLVRLQPQSVEARYNLGCVLRGMGDLSGAVVHFDVAVARKPEIGHMVLELVSALCALNRLSEALDRACAAMLRKPQTPWARLAFASVIGRCGPLGYRSDICTFLVQCLGSDDIEHEELAAATGYQLVMKYGLAADPAKAASEEVTRAIVMKGAGGCLSDRLLHLLLSRTINYDLTLEVFLTEVRRLLCSSPALAAGHFPVMAALAVQCFNNGYAFSVSAAEGKRVRDLKVELESMLSVFSGLTAELEQTLLRYALYAPLRAVAGAERLLGIPHDSPTWLRLLLDRCLVEPLEEARLARDLPCLGDIVDPISREVQAQYEEHPYPRWFRTPPLSQVNLPVMLLRKFPHIPFPSALAGPTEILVVGCGTGRQPIGTAMSFAGVRVLGVDLSRSSLVFAARMARQLGVSNASFLQADILQLSGLGRQFPMIEAVGVLHHMADPMAGWRVLRDLLMPRGFMRIGLYSALARADVAAARAHIGELGLTRSAEDIRSFRQRVLFGEESRRFPTLARSKDMYDLNGCRDLLFHAQEHRFTLAEIARMLDALDLKFVGFEFEVESIPLRYRAAHSSDPSMTDLKAWGRFEEAHPELFSGMYLFWCQKAQDHSRL
jgi:tetratricopeptide (TPR) repeat protein/SAM-dependent methyltransferase